MNFDCSAQRFRIGDCWLDRISLSVASVRAGEPVLIRVAMDVSGPDSLILDGRLSLPSDTSQLNDVCRCAIEPIAQPGEIASIE